jgi:Cupin-like domain
MSSNWLQRFETGQRYSYITDEFPDKKQFPKFYDAKRIDITLEPGDMLHLPAGWYHWVFSEEPDPETGLNVAINYWYKDNWNMAHLDRDPPIKTTHTIHKSIEYMNFLKTFGDKKMYCSSSDNGCFTLPSVRWIQNDAVKCEDHYLSFNEFYEKRNTKEHWYLWAIPDDRLKAYDPKIEQTWELKQNANWWVNFGHVNTAMHYDSTQNLLCQIAGKKRLILFPHSEWSKLYLINPYPPEFIYNILQSEKQRQLQ